MLTLLRCIVVYIIVSMLKQCHGETDTTKDKACGVLEEGWIEFEDACYAYVDKPFTYQQARTYCQGFLGRTADLVFDMNANANIYTLNLVMNKTAFKRTGKLWIGLEVLDANESRWIKNNFNSYRNWIYGHRPKYLRGTCTVMLNNGQWTDSGCFERLPFVCMKVSDDLPENKQQRFIIILTVPATMLLLISAVIFYQITQSKADLNRLKKHISTTEALHFLIANPHLTSQAEEIETIKRDSVAIVLKMKSQKIGKKSNQERFVTVQKKDNKKDDLKTKFMEIEASGAKTNTSKNAEKSRIKDKDVFYIHDEVLANDSVFATVPFRRTKSERISRNEPSLTNPHLRLHRSNSGGFINLCFVNDSNRTYSKQDPTDGVSSENRALTKSEINNGNNIEEDENDFGWLSIGNGSKKVVPCDGRSTVETFKDGKTFEITHF